jgi:hypothetical protein
MTLAITALCKDSAYVRTDRRSTTKTVSGTSSYQDSLNKILKSSDGRMLVYNHGINRIHGKDWRDLAQLIINSVAGSPIANIGSAMAKAEKLVGKDASAELATNTIHDMTAFVIIARTRPDRIEAGELVWKKGEGCSRITHAGLIRSGDGIKYLSIPPNMDTISHWAGLSFADAKAEVDALFKDALARQLAVKGEDFSGTYDEATL